MIDRRTTHTLSSSLQLFPSLPGLHYLPTYLPTYHGEEEAWKGPPISDGGSPIGLTTRVVRGKTHNPGDNPGCRSRGGRNMGNNPGCAFQKEVANTV